MDDARPDIDTLFFFFGWRLDFGFVFWYNMRRFSIRRGVRVVDGATLERLCGGNSTGGSNPPLSATKATLRERIPKDAFWS